MAPPTDGSIPTSIPQLSTSLTGRGMTLGGGVGCLVRKYGMTIDDLLAADIVTADGELLRVDEKHHPDLFWAIRGGGGSVGVATRCRFLLHELDTVVGGMLMPPATADVVAEFIALAEAAPEELSTIANVMPAPPMPFIPEEHHGKLVVLAFMCYAGETEAGQRAMAPFRALAPPLRQDDAGAYVNFLVDEGEARIREAYPGPTWDRLAAIKARYDPTNLFRLNQNIPPAVTEGRSR